MVGENVFSMMAGLVRQASSHWEWKRRRAMQDFGTSQQLYNGCKTTSLPLEAMLEGYKSSSSPLLVLLILFVITVFLRRLRTFSKLRDKQYIVPESRIGDLCTCSLQVILTIEKRNRNLTSESWKSRRQMKINFSRSRENKAKNWS